MRHSPTMYSLTHLGIGREPDSHLYIVDGGLTSTSRANRFVPRPSLSIISRKAWTAQSLWCGPCGAMCFIAPIFRENVHHTNTAE